MPHGGIPETIEARRARKFSSDSRRGRRPLQLRSVGVSESIRGERPACTEKRKARFIQRDRPEAGVEPARENYGYFFPEIELSVRLKILSIWIAAPR